MRNRKYGWKKDKRDHRDHKFRYSKIDIPENVDLREYCSPIEDQKSYGSCTGCASVGCLELLDRKNDMKHTDLSRFFAYYNARSFEGTTGVDSGAYIRDVVKGLVKYGACTEELWKYEVRNLYRKPDDSCYKNASKHKIIAYERVRSIRGAQEALAQGFPVVFGLYLYSSFEKTGYNGIVRTPGWFERFLGGHAMAIVGYKKIDGKLYFIVRNSWSDNWGDKGYCYVPVNYIKRKGSDFWVLRKFEE